MKMLVELEIAGWLTVMAPIADNSARNAPIRPVSQNRCAVGLKTEITLETLTERSFEND
jgi:hypothetical protein